MNPDKNTKEYIDSIRHIKLSNTTRARIESNLLEYARFHGVREGVRVEEDSRFIGQVPQRTSYITQLFKLKLSRMTALILIALIIGGGTSYAAEGSLPGDMLYLVKVEVNENVKSAFAFSNEAEANLQARLTEERLEEAEKLALRGALTADAAAGISSRLSAHVKNAETLSEQAEADGNLKSSATVRASLEGTLRAYADVLTQLNTSIPGNNGTSLITTIRTHADMAARAQATATLDISVDAAPSIALTIATANSKIAEASTKLEDSKNDLTLETTTRFELRLDEAIKAHANAKAQLEARSYRAAYTEVQSALRIAQEVNSGIDSMISINIHTQNNIDLKNIVDIETNTDSQDSGGSDSTTTDTETEINLEVNTNTDVDTSILDTTLDTNTTVNTETRIGL